MRSDLRTALTLLTVLLPGLRGWAETPLALELPMPPPPPGYRLLPIPPLDPVTAPPSEVRKPRAMPSGKVEGTVQGGAAGAAGTVVWLTRVQGTTPKPRPAPRQLVLQRGKQFLPHVLAVPVGTEVSFVNEDRMFHNVFSVSRPNAFDLGLYRDGVARSQVFSEPGPVRLLCSIHASMSAFVYVVDSPWYTQADAAGRFSLRGIPPGEYVLHAWHETSLRPSTQHITVGEGRVSVAVSVAREAEATSLVSDAAERPGPP